MILDSHILAGFSLGFKHRILLFDLIRTTPVNRTILDLDPEKLKHSGIEALALDFDGVLAHHGAAIPLDSTQAWLRRAVTIFGKDRIIILSNKPTGSRIRWFAIHFPGVRFISGLRKKPYPDGLIKAAQLSGVPASSLLMVDDRLLTGCLAAIAAGSQPCYIPHPFISLSHRPAAELFFMQLRMLERVFVRLATLF